MVRVIARPKQTITRSRPRRFSIRVIARAKPTRTRGGGGKISTSTPTPAEKVLKTSLPANLRNKPVAEVRKSLRVAKQLSAQGSTGRITIFGQQEKFARSFKKATGATTFTLAVPIKRTNGKIEVRDFNFLFDNGKLIKAKPTGRAVITENQFLAADLRRRKRNPGFNFGSTLRTSQQKKVKKPKRKIRRRLLFR